MKAKTDAGPTEQNSAMPDYIQNIFMLMALVSEESTVQKFKDDFNGASIRYGDMKKQLAEDMVKFITPIRERATEIRKDEAYLKKVMKEGAEKARESAAETIKQARQLVGLNYL
jgi:tryptophanyl-tRNA synthetase